MQARLGVAGKMASMGHRLVRDHMPDQHRDFFAQLPMLLVGAVDAAGDAWAAVVFGRPGFASSPDARTLRIDALPAPGDPVAAAIERRSAVAVLGIQLETRRRNRMNGEVTGRDGRGFTVTVEQSFGNCPQYIQTRAHRFTREPGAAPGRPAELLPALDEEARRLVTTSDTFFVASYMDVDGDAGRRGVDVSHRGGRPGFVHIGDDGTLTIPDYSGNRFFNTLGNLLANPRAGLLFVDFDRGDLLQLTGDTEIVFDAPEITAYPGAERLWRFRVRQAVRRRGAVPLRWTFGELSPSLPPAD